MTGVPDPHRIAALTQREKATLRLLLAGHDAKSIAAHQGLSVHTVNERLRDARRKLGAASSREAARMLAAAEDPQFLGDSPFGVAPLASIDTSGPPPGQIPPRRQRPDRSLAWLSGGMLIMSILIAVALIATMNPGAPAPTSAITAAAPDPADAAIADAATAWLALIDADRLEASWDAAGGQFRAGLPRDRWPAEVGRVRQPLGALSSRSLQTVTRTETLPGAPAGDYAVLVFRSDFAGKSGAVETVVLAREAGAWKVNGYFLR